MSAYFHYCSKSEAFFAVLADGTSVVHLGVPKSLGEDAYLKADSKFQFYTREISHRPMAKLADLKSALEYFESKAK
jgi:hypothetical protein